MIVCIGGGHGLIQVAKALKSLGVKATYVVTVFDDGGDTGKIREKYNVPALGDIRKQIYVLSESPMRFLLNKKYDHKLGNLILLAYVQEYGFLNGILNANKDFKVFGEILPVSNSNSYLYAKSSNGSVIPKAESKLEKNPYGKIIDVWLKPPAKALDEVINRVLKSDYIFIGPGSFFGSILSNFLAKGLRKAIQETKAKVYFIMNISWDPEITGYSLEELMDTALKYVGRIDYWIMNKNVWHPKHIKPKTGENILLFDLADQKYNRHAVKKLAGMFRSLLSI